MRWQALLLIVVAGCGGSQQPETDAHPIELAALVGAWSDGTITVWFDDLGHYGWEGPAPCSEPPCPTDDQVGNYEVRSGRIYLEPEEGEEWDLDLMMGEGSEAIVLSSYETDTSWTLTRQ